MAAQWYLSRRRCVRVLFVAFLLYLTFLVASVVSTVADSENSSFKTTGHQDSKSEFIDQTSGAIMAHVGSMKSALLALASSALVAGQNVSSYAGSSSASTGTPTTDSVITATVDGVATTFSNAYTIPASADVGPNLLPNVQDPDAVQAQDICPGYTAGGVEKTANGFTATLSLAGEPVGIRRNTMMSYTY